MCGGYDDAQDGEIKRNKNFEFPKRSRWRLYMKYFKVLENDLEVKYGTNSHFSTFA